MKNEYWILTITICPIFLAVLLLFKFLARPGLTKLKKPCVYYESQTHPECYYQYTERHRNGERRRDRNGDLAYQCGGCAAERMRRSRNGDPEPGVVCQIGVNDDGYFTSDPDQQIHICNPYPKDSWIGKQMYRRVAHEITASNISGGEGLSKYNALVAVFGDYPRKQLSVPVGVAFLRNKTEATYIEMFRKLLELLDNDIGVRKRFHFDQESAAINAIRNVFRGLNFEIINCFFHYQKNIREYATNKCGNLMVNQNFQKWIRRIIGASFLPAELQLQIITTVLNQEIELPQNRIEDFAKFKTYYRNQWIPKLGSLNFYDDDENCPRTTNAGEGFHKSIKTKLKSQSDPTFKTCYNIFRELLRDGALHWMKHSQPGRMPLRRNDYIDAENRIMQKKNELQVYLDMAPEPENDMEYLLKYCEHQSYNTTPEFDPARVEAVVQAPLQIRPPPVIIRPELQMRPPPAIIRPRFIPQQFQQHQFIPINPNLQQNPLQFAQQHQLFMNQQFPIIQNQQDYEAWLFHQQMIQNGFRFP